MKTKFTIITLLFVFVLSSGMQGQDWVAKMKDPTVNFFEVKKSFNKYHRQKDKELDRMRKRAERKEGEGMTETDEMEVPGYFQYKRWEWFMAPRVSQSGERFDPARVWKERETYSAQNKMMNAGNWTLIGPTNNIPSGGGGAGRLNFVRVDPTNANNIWVGSPAGGLWKSVTGGTNWTTTTDQLSQVIGCTDLAIDPTNTNVMYLATGDGDAGDTYTVGVLKTTDGGVTWNTTGLSYNIANYRQISKILINPNSTNIVLVATTAGIFRSTDFGVTYTNVQAGAFKDMEMKPGDPNTVYCCGTEFYKSTDGGQTWTKTLTGLPVAIDVSRMAIAVTPANPDYVYLIAGLPAPNYGTEGFYKSTNSGSSFTNPSTPGLGNQQWYDLCIASSPTNADEVLLGGQTDFLRSTNGGSTWSQNGGFTHVDYHDVIYTSSATYFLASDGGLFKTTNSGSTWTDLSNGLQIAQMYGFGHSATNVNLIIQGWQDNGTNKYNGANWSQIMGGDGMLCFIDWNNDQNMWAEYYEGALQRSTNGGLSWSGPATTINEVGAWVTPYLQDPVVSTTVYAGFNNVWKSVNGGANFSKISNFSGTSTVTTIEVSPADPLVIWASRAGALMLTTNGGATWSTISNVPSGTITGIACSNTDPLKAWITYSGFANVNKVFQTNDQGVSWINLSASVPNIPINCILYIPNSNDALYIGTDVGVYHKDASMSVWQPFYNGLPNVIVTQLEVFAPNGKIRASTYGRGMWESDPYLPGTYLPTAAFGASVKIACPGTAVQYNDYSAGQPTAWDWSFPGGSPGTSNQQNPMVYYNTPGMYPVTLIVTNAIGVDTVIYNNYISISTSPVAAPSTADAVICGPAVANLSATGSGTGNLRWWDAPGGGNLLATGSNYSPNVTGTTSFYVDEEFPGGILDYAGANGNAIGAGAYFTANDIRGLYFDVLQPIILNTVDVYCNSSGDRTIEVIDAQGNTVVDTTVFIPASPGVPQSVTVNFTLYPGTNYFIKCRGLVDLFRNTAGATYPYISTGITITGSNAGLPGYYYFFYNWVFTIFTCNTPRAQATVWDTCAVQGIGDHANLPVLDVYPNPANGEFSFNLHAQKDDNYQVKITNAIGQVVYKDEMRMVTGENKRKLNISSFGKGIYMLRISNDENNLVKEVIIY